MLIVMPFLQDFTETKNYLAIPKVKLVLKVSITRTGAGAQVARMKKTYCLEIIIDVPEVIREDGF